jgi:hypothetical protein
VLRPYKKIRAGGPWARACERECRRGCESVWQLCCLGAFLVISMIHLHSSGVVGLRGLSFH